MAKKEDKKKGLLGRAIDAVTSRDEKEAAEQSAKEAEEAKTQAAQEAAARRAAEVKAESEARRAKAAEERAKEAEKAAEEAAREARRQAAEAAREKLHAEREAKAAAAEAEQTYVVKSGDSLSKIAKELLGDASRWPEIFEANKETIKDPNLIRVGQELRIPKE